MSEAGVANRPFQQLTHASELNVGAKEEPLLQNRREKTSLRCFVCSVSKLTLQVRFMFV